MMGWRAMLFGRLLMSVNAMKVEHADGTRHILVQYRHYELRTSSVRE